MQDGLEEGTWQAAWPSTVPDAGEIAAEVQRLTPYAAQDGVYQGWLRAAIESARGGTERDRNDADYWLEKLREQEELDRNRGKAWE